MRLGPLELVLREPAVTDLLELIPDQPDDGLRLRRRRAAVGGEESGLRVLRVIAVRRVGEPALLPDLLEQPRRHPATEGGVDDEEREPVRIRAREPVRPDDHVGLLGLLPLDEVAARGCRGARGVAETPRGISATVPLAPHVHALAEHAHEVLVADVPGDGHDEPCGHVVPPVEAANGSARGRADPFARAQDRPSERMTGPEGRREQVVDDVLGRVLVHVDLRQDHVPLRLEVARSDRRMLEHVRHVVYGHLQVAIEDPGVIARVFLGGERVDVTADAVERLRDVQRAPRRRPLEQQMLQEVAVAADRRPLVA